MINSKEDLVVCFSGGRTSGYMCKFLQKYMSHIYKLHFVYANSGLEHKKTLKFVNKCDKKFKLNLVWLESVVHHDVRKASTYKIVNYKSASMKGEPFEEVIKKYGLPNQNFLHCTRELKNNPIKAWRIDNNLTNAKIALGIRGDEYRRIKNRPDAIYPLAHIKHTTKAEILDWWKKQKFDLNLPEHLGNCVGCYKKSDKKLDMVKDEDGGYFDFFIDMENKYATVKPQDGFDKRIIYRHNRTALEVSKGLNKPENRTEVDECVEECGSIIVEEVQMINSKIKLAECYYGVDAETGTGCSFCAFGILQGNNRIAKLIKTKPKQARKILDVENNGISFRKALKIINKHYNLDMEEVLNEDVKDDK